MASTVTQQDVMVNFLRDFIEITEDENIARIQVFEKLQDSYKIISKYEVELAFLLCEQGIEPPSLSSLTLQNHFSDDQIIIHNLEYLTGCTGNWPVLKVQLRSKSLLSDSQIQILDNIPDERSRNYKMYEWVTKKPKNINELIICLNKSNNSDIAEVIREAQLIWIKNKAKLSQSFWAQIEAKVTKCQNHEVLVQLENVADQIGSEKSKLSDAILKAEAEKQLIKKQYEKMFKKLKKSLQAEVEAKAKLEIAEDIDKPRLTEELNCLQQRIHELQKQKNELEAKVSKYEGILKSKNERLKEMEFELEKNLKKLEDMKMDKLELEQQILNINSSYELEMKQNENVLVNVRLDFITKIKNLKRQLYMHESADEEKDKIQTCIEKLTHESLANKELADFYDEAPKLNIMGIREPSINVIPSFEHGPVIAHQEDTIILENDPHSGTVMENLVSKEHFVFEGQNNILFEPPDSGFNQLISIVIKSCKINFLALKRTFRNCSRLKSLHLENVELAEIYYGDVQVNLPYLEDVVICTKQSRSELTHYGMNSNSHIVQNFIFWRYLKIEDMGRLTTLKTNIHIVCCSERILYINRENREYVFDGLIVDTEMLSDVWSLALNRCSITSSALQLHLTDLCVMASLDNLVNLLAQTKFLKSLRFIQYDKVEASSFNISSLSKLKSLKELSIMAPRIKYSRLSGLLSSFSQSSNVFSNLRTLCLCSDIVNSEIFENFQKLFPVITHLFLRLKTYKDLANSLLNIFQSLTLQWIRIENIIPEFLKYLRLKGDQLVKRLGHVSSAGDISQERISVELDNKCGMWECTHEQSDKIHGCTEKGFEMLGYNKFYTSRDSIVMGN